MKTGHLPCSALLLGLAGSAVWAASLGITLTNQLPHCVPVLLVDGPLDWHNQLQLWTLEPLDLRVGVPARPSQ